MWIFSSFPGRGLFWGAGQEPAAPFSGTGTLGVAPSAFPQRTDVASEVEYKSCEPWAVEEEARCLAQGEGEVTLLRRDPTPSLGRGEPGRKDGASSGSAQVFRAACSLHSHLQPCAHSPVAFGGHVFVAGRGLCLWTSVCVLPEIPKSETSRGQRGTGRKPGSVPRVCQRQGAGQDCSGAPEGRSGSPTRASFPLSRVSVLIYNKEVYSNKGLSLTQSPLAAKGRGPDGSRVQGQGEPVLTAPAQGALGVPSWSMLAGVPDVREGSQSPSSHGAEVNPEIILK